jgi:hypothetical protein
LIRELSGKVNVTELPGGHESGQLIYEPLFGPRYYVYVDDDKITSIQKSYGEE